MVYVGASSLGPRKAAQEEDISWFEEIEKR